MLYRNIRKIATGEWVDVLYTADGANFSVPADVHIADMAGVLSLNVDELEAIEGSSDARTGTLINQPVVSTTFTRKEELIIIGKDGWTDAQQKELIEILAQE